MLAPLSVRYFDPSGFFAVGGVQYVGQSVTAVSGSTENESWGDSWLLDAAIGYRLPNRRGIVSLELNNILDQNVHWQDDTFSQLGAAEPAVHSRTVGHASSELELLKGGTR